MYFAVELADRNSKNLNKTHAEHEREGEEDGDGDIDDVRDSWQAGAANVGAEGPRPPGGARTFRGRR